MHPPEADNPTRQPEPGEREDDHVYHIWHLGQLGCQAIVWRPPALPVSNVDDRPISSGRKFRRCLRSQTAASHYLFDLPCPAFDADVI
jgi:hypothetical protein